jgi:hypothetical protein
MNLSGQMIRRIGEQTSMQLEIQLNNGEKIMVEKDNEDNSFMKFDSSKTRMELLDPYFIEGIADVLTFGAEKYEVDNWKKAGSDTDRERIKGALMRHWSSYMKGEVNDPDTKLSHLYHIACNLQFLDYFDRKE